MKAEPKLGESRTEEMTVNRKSHPEIEQLLARILPWLLLLVVLGGTVYVLVDLMVLRATERRVREHALSVFRPALSQKRLADVHQKDRSGLPVRIAGMKATG